jgi:hypothetical protein
MSPLFSGRRLAAGLAVAGALLLVPAAAYAAAPHSSGITPRLVGIPACVNAHAAAAGGAFVWSGNPGDGFAGGQAFEVEITNVGKKDCSLRGVPGLAAIDQSTGHLVGKEIPPVAKGPLVTLKPGATAHIGLTIHIPAMCNKPVSAEAYVYLPGQKQGQDTYLGALACPGFAGGGVLVSTAIASGTGIPLYSI